MGAHANCYVVLRAAGVAVVLDVTGGQLPAVVHWGGDIGPVGLDDARGSRSPACTTPLPTSSTNPCGCRCSPSTGRDGWAGQG